MRRATGRKFVWAAALLAASCSSVSPVKVVPGDICYRCRRPIADNRLAAEILDGTLASKFRTSGCLAKYLATHPSESGLLFVTDFKTGELIDPNGATFVPVVIDPNTNESDYRAFLSLADAEVAAVEARTLAIGWKRVLANVKG